MPFGKFKGQRIKDIPRDYKQWMIRTFEWTERNEKLRQSLITTM
jgi:DNA repair protein RadD